LRIILIFILIPSLLSCTKKPFLTSAKSGDEAYQECHALSEKGNYEKANECLELLKSRFGGSGAATGADLEIGDNYFRKGEYLLAAETYLVFAKLHPTHEKAGYAYYRVGLCYLRESPKAVDRDQQYLHSAIQYLELGADMMSGDLREVAREKLVEARTRIAKRHFYIGRFYYRTGEYISAIPRFQEILTNYPGLGLDERSLYLLGDSFRHISEKEKALEILTVFDQHFPQSPYRKKLARQIGVK
jgi:outer membrane protein assembly factor BamD